MVVTVRSHPDTTDGAVAAPLATVGPMRQLVPSPADDVDPVATYLAAARPRPIGRPWIAMGMVASIDGATAVDGRSGGLGGDADKAVFRAVRAIADVIIVGAGTVRAEDYGPVRYADEVRAARRAAGRDEAPPRLAIVTSSLDLELSGRVFHDGAPPIVFTTTDAPDDRVAATAEVAEVHRCGTGRVDLVEAASTLAELDVGIVVSEGGPSLNGALASAGLIDEICLSLAPQLAGGDSARIVAGADAIDAEFELASLLTADDVLFGRWTRR